MAEAIRPWTVSDCRQARDALLYARVPNGGRNSFVVLLAKPALSETRIAGQSGSVGGVRLRGYPALCHSAPAVGSAQPGLGPYATRTSDCGAVRPRRRRKVIPQK